MSTHQGWTDGPGERQADPSSPGTPKLTTRQQEVLEAFVASGREDDVAAALRISRDTVREHLKHIRLKVGVSTAPELFAFVINSSFVPMTCPRCGACFSTGR